MKLTTTLLALALVVAGCGIESEPRTATTAATGPTTTSATQPIPEDAIVLEADVVGGCFMMGPNCARYVVRGDGSVETYRLGADPAELVGTGAIDPVLVSDLWVEVTETDMEALRASLGPGECQACVDGVDTELVLTVDGQSWSFSSADVDFDEREPVFAMVALIIRDAASETDIPIITR